MPVLKRVPVHMQWLQWLQWEVTFSQVVWLIGWLTGVGQPQINP